MIYLAKILTRKISDVCLMSYTEPRRHNGRGRGRSFEADVETIATTARQLAEMVLLAVDGTTQQNMHGTGCNADHDMMLYSGIETCPECHCSTRPL